MNNFNISEDELKYFNDKLYQTWLQKSEWDSIKKHYENLNEEDKKEFVSLYPNLSVLFYGESEYKIFLKEIVHELNQLYHNKPFSIILLNLEGINVHCLTINNEKKYAVHLYAEYLKALKNELNFDKLVTGLSNSYQHLSN